MRIHRKQFVRRRAITLVELLVVLGIFALLVGAALPLMRIGLADRKVREASRQLNALCAGAQARAAEIGRPVGLWLERSPTNPAIVQDMYLAEVPLPYTGDVAGALATVQLDNSDSRWEIGFTGSATLTNTNTLVKRGDAFGIKFDYKGQPYQAVRAANGDFVLTLPTGTPPPGSLGGLPFQIYRYPRRSIVAPMELPSGVCLDLNFSGTGVSGAEFAPASPSDPYPIMVLFSPSASVAQVYLGVYDSSTSTVLLTGIQPLGSIHFLIGRTEKVGATTPTDTNLFDTSNRWVSIGHISGTVTTSENLGFTLDANKPSQPDAADLAAARAIASSAQTMGGR